MFRRFIVPISVFAGVLFSSAVVAQPRTLKTEVLAAYWEDLRELDGEQAFRAMRRMAGTPQDTLSFLRDAVPPATTTVTAPQIDALIRQLDSARFAERDKARQELERLDWQALDALRKAAKTGVPLETKRRIEQLIARGEGPLSGANLRWHRTVEVVEWIGGADAKALLERWGQGVPASQLTQQANKVHKRWDSRPQYGLPRTHGAARPVDAQGDSLPGGAMLRLGSARWRLEERDTGSIHYTPDGKRLIVVGGAILGVINVADGKILVRMESDRYGGWSASSARLTPDGKRLVASGWSYGKQMRFPSVRVWDVATFKEINQWPVEGNVLGFAAKANAVLLGTPKGIQQYDMDTGRALDFFPLPKENRGQVLALHGTTAVVSSSQRDRLLVYDLAAPEKATTLSFPEDRLPSSFAFSPDGRVLACGTDYYGLLLFDVVTGTPIRHIVAKDARYTAVRSLLFSTDGKTLVFTSHTHGSHPNETTELVAWDMDQHKPRWKRAGGGAGYAFSPDGRFIAGKTGSLSSARLSVWEADTGKEITGSVEAAAAYTSEAAFAADGKSVMTVQGNAVRLWEFPSGKVLKEFGHDRVHAAALSPDGRRLATSSFNHGLRIWDTASGRELMKFPDRGSQNGHARDFIFTGYSQRLCTWEADCRLFVWNVNTGRLVAEHLPRPDGFPKDLFDDDNPRGRQRAEKELFFGSNYCFSPDGARFLWQFSKLRVYDTASGKEVQTLEEDIDFGYYRPQLSDDREWLLIGGGSDQPRTLVNLRLGKKFGQLEFGGASRSGAGAMSPDGRSFALEISAGGERKIVLYETATLRPRLALPVEYGYAYRLAFSPGGRFLAVILIDGTVLIWDVLGTEIKN